MPAGIIYILINEAMPGYTKVGKTTTSVEQRMRELDTSGTPLPFECFYAARVRDMDFVERRLHDAFDDRRVRPRREFFKVDPERIRSALELAAIEDVTPKGEVVEDSEDQIALNEARRGRAGFNFEMVGIPVGAVLTFTKDPAITCTVVRPGKVLFEGEEISLSAAALKVVRGLGYNWPTIAGPTYWEFEGETLAGRRQRMEEEG